MKQNKLSVLNEEKKYWENVLKVFPNAKFPTNAIENISIELEKIKKPKKN